MSQIEKILSFTVEIEKLKSVYRKTRPVGLERYENSAEHSWHVCLCALMLKDFANDNINIDRVIKMLLIHDLGEIDCGDTIVYAAENQELKESEAIGVERILNFLPEEQKEEYLALWQEFEAGESEDSKYAKAIDRVPPLLHNLHDEGHSWKKNNVTKDQIFSVNSRIGHGSEKLWDVIKGKLKDAISSGILE